MKLDVREARSLLRRCDYVSLATQSMRLPGFPFVSHAPIAHDGAGRLVLLLSRLAEHSRNLGADPRVSVMATLGGADPQAQPRVSAVGELRTADLSPAQQDRYVRYHPEAGAFLGFGDFRFYRLEVVRVRMVEGFARAGWIDPKQWRARELDERQENTLMEELAADARTSGASLLGLDWEGMDLRSATGARTRLDWAADPADAAELVLLARAAFAGPS